MTRLRSSSCLRHNRPMGAGVFDSPLDGLELAEAEFAMDDEMVAVTLPPYAHAEITNDPRFLGCLAGASRADLTQWLADDGLEIRARSTGRSHTEHPRAR